MKNKKSKITILITAFKEPNIDKALESALNQNVDYNYEVILSAPDKETLNKAKSFKNKYSNLKIFKDPGKGKSFALNLIIPKIKFEILVLTDGDVYLDKNALAEIVNVFSNEEIGCVSGRPVPQEPRNTKFGYFAHFLFDAAHQIRKKAFENKSFIECSGYLFAFRNNVIKNFPLDVSEDAIIPYYFQQKGYRIGYAEKAEVYVKNPANVKDWIKQKTRNNKAHEKLNRYVDTKSVPRVKSFKTEIKGVFLLFSYPKNIKEFFWTLELFSLRFYTWAKCFFDTKIMNKEFSDGWERIESTK